ncbi:hypothetical protein I308_103478 [Cryptococcus tetragattii IND107]|uniref:Uncharacterized protein n=1 Tax=Cryptococcus tetragattii IND107 TaxID=1296105 RepID=A0ABR3BT88_9TREE
MPPPFTTLPLVPREPPTSPTTPPSSSMSLASLLSILLPLLMLLLAIITLGVYKYVGWRRGKKLDKAVEKHAREVEQRRKLAKIRYAYGIPGMYGSGYDGDRGISGPPVGWCTQKWLEASARRSFISLSSLSVSSSHPCSLVDNTENNTTTESHYETKGQGSDQKRYSQLYQQLQGYRPSAPIGGDAPSYRVLRSHTDEIPLSPDQYGYTINHQAPNSPFQPFSSPPFKQCPTDLPRPQPQPQPQNTAATTDVTKSSSSPPSLPLPTFAIGDDSWIGIEEAMPSRIFPLKSTATTRRFEKRTSPLKRQFEMGSVEDDHAKPGFMRGKLFEKGSSLGLSRVEKQTSTCSTPIEDVFHTLLIYGPGVSDQSDHLEFTDADSSVTAR